MNRSRVQLEQDRADLLAALEEAGEPLRTGALICRAKGLAEPGSYDSHWWPHYGRASTDLRALVRAGKIRREAPRRDDRWSTWALATPADLDADEDLAEVRRLLTGWEPAEGAG